MRPALALFGLLVISPAAFADDPQLYRWTDAQGVVHYSDQPPAETAPDLKTSDMPAFPVVDQAKLDQEQAALLAEAAALQQLAQAQAAAQAAARLAAAELAARQTPPPVPATDDSHSSSPIYVSSAFVPRIYRANLYLPAGHRAPAPCARTPQFLHSTSISLLRKP